MLVFPQLLSGAMAQLPLTRETRFRTRRNQMRNGNTVHLADPDFEQRSWDLVLRDLTDTEWQAIEDLYHATRGKIGSFAFLDPGANLLRWSENPAQAPWSPTGVAIESEPDPFGGLRAAQLPSGLSVSQSLNAPAGYRYAASAWLRSTAGGAFLRVSDDGAAVREQAVTANGQWTRYAVRYDATSAAETVVLTFGAGSGPLSIYGAQLEAQTATSPYKRTTERGGVFPNTRFDQDTLVERATAPGKRETRIRLIWTPSQT